MNLETQAMLKLLHILDDVLQAITLEVEHGSAENINVAYIFAGLTVLSDSLSGVHETFLRELEKHYEHNAQLKQTFLQYFAEFAAPIHELEGEL